MKTLNTKVYALDKSRWVFGFNVAAKTLLVTFFLIALLFDLPQLEGKAMNFRAPFYIGAICIVPILGFFKKWKPYPHMGDLMLAMPFLLDTFGNMFGLFDSWVFYDDVIHMINWLFLVMAYLAFRFRKITDNRDAILLGIGFGAIAIILWEIMEWVVSVDGFGVADNLSLTYGDTVGDLFMSFMGGVVGAILGVRLFGEKKGK